MRFINHIEVVSQWKCMWQFDATLSPNRKHLYVWKYMLSSSPSPSLTEEKKRSFVASNLSLLIRILSLFLISNSGQLPIFFKYTKYIRHADWELFGTVNCFFSIGLAKKNNFLWDVLCVSQKTNLIFCCDRNLPANLVQKGK